MPLTQATAITFAAPLILAVLAGPLLGEWVGWRGGLAVLAGFGGGAMALLAGLLSRDTTLAEHWGWQMC